MAWPTHYGRTVLLRPMNWRVRVNDYAREAARFNWLASIARRYWPNG